MSPLTRQSGAATGWFRSAIRILRDRTLTEATGHGFVLGPRVAVAISVRRHLSLLLGYLVFALGAACSSSLTGADGGGRTGAGGSGAATGADGSFPAQGNPMSPCSVDSDCGNAYLTCVPQTVYACRDPGADAGSGPSKDLPICPTTAQVTENQCTVRYQLPCQVDSDCGPAGFTCDHSCSNSGTSCGICSEDGPGPCSSDDQCPQGWSCYTPCPCGSTPFTGGSCNPPFAIFNCPACITTSVDGGSPSGSTL